MMMMWFYSFDGVFNLGSWRDVTPDMLLRVWMWRGWLIVWLHNDTNRMN